MITMYRTRFGKDIEDIEVDRITDKSIWIGGRRRSLGSSWEKYHSTWEEAHTYLLQRAESAIDRAAQELWDTRARLKEIMAMVKP